jgi:predicted transcriptional regulator
MKQPVITADEEVDIRDAVEIMKCNKIRNIIVTRGKEITGVVKRSTILNNITFDEDDVWTQEALEEKTIEQPTVSSK